MTHEATAQESSEPDPPRDSSKILDTPLARDVATSLRGERPSIPCRYLYDDRGSRLFDEITLQPEYYLTRTEEAILEQHADAIVARAAPHELVELGSGTGKKVPTLLQAVKRAGMPAKLVLFEINAAMINASVARVKREHPEVQVTGVVGTFPDELQRLGPGGDRLVLFLGSTLGNQHPAQVPGFLTRVAQQMHPGDDLLLGLDLVKDPARLEAAYNDAAGVTASFSLNLLSVLNRELGADFDASAFEHVAVWEAESSWIRIALRARRDQHVRVPGAGVELRLRAGQEIQTEVSCKYTRPMLEQRLAGTGLALDQWHTDAHEDFAVALLRREADADPTR
ncbi:MAG: histidine N-alpha-methyltransferase [Planctomycetota bacterium]|nr:MAG: histidine N-alpha-methyltransferase [Planctomycetota bacterium]